MFLQCSCESIRFAPSYGHAVHGDSTLMEQQMQHDLRRRTAARAIYDNIYPLADSKLFSFDEAERFGTVEYRKAVGAAQDARSVLAVQHEQLRFTAIL